MTLFLLFTEQKRYLPVDPLEDNPDSVELPSTLESSEELLTDAADVTSELTSLLIVVTSEVPSLEEDSDDEEEIKLLSVDKIEDKVVSSVLLPISVVVSTASVVPSESVDRLAIL